jgi:hypothetical protein
VGAAWSKSQSVDDATQSAPSSTHSLGRRSRSGAWFGLLSVEILTLRHQLNVLRRNSPKRLTFSNFDRLVFAPYIGLRRPL